MKLKKKDIIKVKIGDKVIKGQTIAEGNFVNKSFYISLGRFLLLGLFLFICFLVYKAGKKNYHNMNTSALITLLITQSIVTSCMVYFFVKVLRTPKNVESDSFSENDDEE